MNSGYKVLLTQGQTYRSPDVNSGKFVVKSVHYGIKLSALKGS